MPQHWNTSSGLHPADFDELPGGDTRKTHPGFDGACVDPPHQDAQGVSNWRNNAVSPLLAEASIPALPVWEWSAAAGMSEWHYEWGAPEKRQRDCTHWGTGGSSIVVWGRLWGELEKMLKAA